ncbi:hypothetical protein EQO05_06235 [Methanosarcina sp. MSH10X1]|uniref:hypothetical protein n=1 Tax=Methanosarcina sp. MSH10X1 TaxID=2507075 RepID=UPI000FFB1B05|nr:hypothetical protein [Methanosarcina sp. MSH10X1]RXA20179.1 hypothetical protein EQO05_06235 [Methanosarcina sp. MSH10X1]
MVFDKTFFEKVFAQAFLQKACVAPVDHAVSWGFSLKPFLKRLAIKLFFEKACGQAFFEKVVFKSLRIDLSLNGDFI